MQERPHTGDGRGRRPNIQASKLLVASAPSARPADVPDWDASGHDQEIKRCRNVVVGAIPHTPVDGARHLQSRKGL